MVRLFNSRLTSLYSLLRNLIPMVRVQYFNYVISVKLDRLPSDGETTPYLSNHFTFNFVVFEVIQHDFSIKVYMQDVIDGTVEKVCGDKHFRGVANQEGSFKQEQVILIILNV